MRALILALLVLALAAPSWAAPKTDVFVNNKPFKGAVSGPPSDLMLEAGPYFKLAGGDFQFDAVAGTATLDGAPVNVTVVGGKAFVRAKEMVSMVGGRYSANAALGSVDIYAFDPVEAARKAWERIFAMPAITNDQDFQIMATLTRGILTKAGLDLDFPVELILATQEQIVAEGGSANLDCLSRYSYLPGGTGIANAKILVVKGQRPANVMHLLAYGWGAFYGSRLGLQKNHDLLGGIGLWAGYHVMHELGVTLRPEQWGLSQSAGERSQFMLLMKPYESGGAAAVIVYLKNMSAGK